MEKFSLTDIKKMNYSDVYHYIYNHDCCSKQNIANDLKMHFMVKETKAKIEEKKYEVDLGATNDNLLDINTASEKDITALPGVSVILAKKIIKYRETQGGFENLEEFYKEMKIKPHFIEQLSKLICVKEFKKKKQQKVQNERIIDF